MHWPQFQESVNGVGNAGQTTHRYCCRLRWWGLAKRAKISSRSSSNSNQFLGWKMVKELQNNSSALSWLEDYSSVVLIIRWHSSHMICGFILRSLLGISVGLEQNLIVAADCVVVVLVCWQKLVAVQVVRWSSEKRKDHAFLMNKIGFFFLLIASRIEFEFLNNFEIRLV